MTLDVIAPPEEETTVEASAGEPDVLLSLGERAVEEVETDTRRKLRIQTFMARCLQATVAAVDLGIEGLEAKDQAVALKQIERIGMTRKQLVIGKALIDQGKQFGSQGAASVTVEAPNYYTAQLAQLCRMRDDTILQSRGWAEMIKTMQELELDKTVQSV